MRFGGRALVLGVTEHQVTLLTEVDPAELDAPPDHDDTLLDPPAQGLEPAPSHGRSPSSSCGNGPSAGPDFPALHHRRPLMPTSRGRRALVTSLFVLIVGLLASPGPAEAAPTTRSGAPGAPGATTRGAAATTPVLPATNTAGAPVSNPDTKASISLDLGGVGGKPSQSLMIIVLITLLSVAPALLIMLTSFTRIVIVLSLTRNALGLHTIPPNQVIVGLAMFLSFFVMSPTFGDINRDAIQPLLKGEKTQGQAYESAVTPLRTFMLEADPQGRAGHVQLRRQRRASGRRSRRTSASPPSSPPSSSPS